MASTGKTEIVAQVADQIGQSRSQVADAFDAIVAAMVGTLRDNGSIELRGFCTLKTKATAPRKGRNPRTGEEHLIPAGRKVHFKPSRSLLAD